MPLGDQQYGNFNGLSPQRAIISENIGSVMLASGAGDLGTASTSSLGGTIDTFSSDPKKRFGATLNQTFGSYSAFRAFARVDSGEFGNGNSFYVSGVRQDARAWDYNGHQKGTQANGKFVHEHGTRKLTAYFASIGLPMEDRFLDTLGRHWQTRARPLVIQPFEIANLKYIRQKLGRPSNVQLMQLTEGGDERRADVVKAGGTLTYNQMMKPAGLADIARYADILAPDTRTIIPLGSDKRLAPVSPVTADAHKVGLLVQPWTFRPENLFLAADFQSAEGPAARNPAGSAAEIKAYLAAGIDGFFTDDPATGRQAIGHPPEVQAPCSCESRSAGLQAPRSKLWAPAFAGARHHESESLPM